MRARWQVTLVALILSLMVPAGLLLFARVESRPPLAQAAGAARYVALSGADAGDCTDPITPCRTVQYAVDQATAGNEVLIASGVYTGVQATAGITQSVYLGKSLTLRGGYTTTNWLTSYPISQPTTLDAQGLGRVLVISGTITATIESLNVIRGNANGLRGHRVDSTHYDAGAGIYVYTSTATISNTAVYSNNVTTANARGGGLYLNGARAIVASSAITKNVSFKPGSYGAGSGESGGLYALTGTLLLSGSVISDNLSHTGGGLYLVGGGTFTVANNVIQRNALDYGSAGGGLWIGGAYVGSTYVKPVSVAVVGNSIEGNDPGAWGDGGGLYLQADGARIENNVIANNNTADQGGGIHATGSNLYITGNHIYGHSLFGYYGPGSGGGMLLSGSGIVAGNIITGNNAGSGGGISASGNFILANNVVASNSASSAGAGIDLNAAGSLPTWYELLHNTVARNSYSGTIYGGVYQGSGIQVDGGSSGLVTATLRNNIVVENQGTGVSATGNGRAVMEGTLWYGNVRDNVGTISHSTGNVTTGTINLFTDPGFAADGYHLNANSPAIDAGAHLLFGSEADRDIDGQPRPATYAFDIGADEQPGTALQMTKTPSQLALGPGDTVTYTMMVTVAGGATNRLLVTDTLPAEQQAIAFATSHGTATLRPGWGGGALYDAGALPATTTVYLTLTAQVSTTAPLAELPYRMRNTLSARSDEAANYTYADTYYQYCLARLESTGSLYTRVQSAVDAAPSGDMVKVAGYCPEVTVRGTLTQTVYLSKTLALRGGYTLNDWSTADPSRTRTVLDAQGQGRVLYISGAAISPTIEGFRLTRGWHINQGGGVYVNQSAATLRDNVIQNSSTKYNGYGAGVYMTGAPQAALISNTVMGNSITGGAGYGGGAYLNQSPITLAGNTFLMNVANEGAGLYLKASAATLTSNTFQANAANGGTGGGLYLTNSPATLAGNTVLSNTSTYYGGGLYLSNSPATLAGNAVLSNTTSSNGGGVYLTGSSARLEGNTIQGNRGGSGGGIYSSQSSGGPVLNRNVIRANCASNGGGVYLESPPNSATTLVRPELNGNLIQANTATSYGGGIYSQAGHPIFRSNSVVDNSAVTYGSGIYLSYDSSTSYPSINTFLHTTIARNSGGDRSGVFATGTANRFVTTTFESTIVFSQTIGVRSTSATATVAMTRTLWSNTATRYTGSVTDTLPVAGAADLAEDGYHLNAGSAAIDAGGYLPLEVRLNYDVDGEPRPAAFGLDLGADEQSGTALVMAMSPSSAILRPGDLVTYTMPVTAAGGAANRLVVTDSLPIWQQTVLASTSQGSASPLPGWGGGAVFDVGTLPATTTVYLTLTAQVSPTAALSELPFPMRNTLSARSDEAANYTYADTSYQYCQSVINDNTTVRYNSVQAAINAAAPGDTVKVAGYCAGQGLRSGSIPTVNLTKTLTLRGGYTQDNWTTPNTSRTRTVLDAEGQNRVLYISGSITPSVEGFRIMGGGNQPQGAGVYVDRSAATLRDNIIQNNATTTGSGAGGGGVYVSLAPEAALIANTLQANYSPAGGGVFLNRSPIVLSGNSILSNTAASGGGIYLMSSSARLEGNTIRGNRGNSQGGGVISWPATGYSSGSPILTRNVIRGNAAESGGGLYLYNYGTTGSPAVSPTIEGNLIQANIASGYGGGVYSQEGDSIFRSNAVIENSASSGSGVLLLSSLRSNAQSFQHTTFARNRGGDGSGVYAYAYGSGALTATFENTIVYSHTLGVKNASGPVTIAMTRTLWDDNVTRYTGSVTDNSSFSASAGLAADGYHLAEGAAAIDMALESDAQTDVDGQPRRMGPDADVGADEYPYQADFAISKARLGSGPVNGGDSIIYTLAITNTGPWSPADARVVDSLTPITAVATLTATTPDGSCAMSGTEVTCLLSDVPVGIARPVTVEVTTIRAFGGTLTNSARVAPADAVDPAAFNDAAGSVTTTIIYTGPRPDVAVNKGGPGYTRSGETMVYTVTWQNAGDLAATSAILTDILPAKVSYLAASVEATRRSGQVLAWDLGEAAPGASGTYTIAVETVAGLSKGTILTNTAQVTTATPGDPPGNNTAAVATEVMDPAIVSVRVSHDLYPTEVTAGDGEEYDYSIVIANNGELALDLMLADPIPAGAQYVQGSASAAYGTVSFNQAANRVEWNGPVAPGQQTQVGFKVKVVSCSGLEKGLLSNTVQVTAAGRPEVWSDEKKTKILCSDLAVKELGAQRNVRLGFGGQSWEYQAFVRYVNNRVYSVLGESSAPANLRLVATLDDSGFATFKAAVPNRDREINGMRWEWDLGRLGPGEEMVVIMDIAVHGWVDSGYRLSAYVEGISDAGPEPSPDWDQANNTAEGFTYPFRMIFDKQVEAVKPNFLVSGSVEIDVEYYMRYTYENADPTLPHVTYLAVEDTWPKQLDFQSQRNNSRLAFTKESATLLRWENTEPLVANDVGWIRVKGKTDRSLPAGTPLVNGAELLYKLSSGGLYVERESATAKIPLLPAFLVDPGEGSACEGPHEVTGIAQPGTRVHIFLDNVLEETVVADGQGRFATTLYLKADENAGQHEIYATVSTGSVIGSTGDEPDANPGDGECNTSTVSEQSQCTLRAAIEEANATAGHDLITFNIPGGGVPVIRPRSPLPWVEDALLIDATTQPGGRVELNGSNAGASANGLRIHTPEAALKGLTIKGFKVDGILATTGGFGLDVEGYLVLEDIESVENCGWGIWVEDAVEFFGSTRVNDNGRGDGCSGGGIASDYGIKASSIEVTGNNGPGIWSDFVRLENARIISNTMDGINYLSELHLDGTNNEVAGNGYNGICNCSPPGEEGDPGEGEGDPAEEKLAEIDGVYLHGNGAWGLKASTVVTVTQMIRANDNRAGGITTTILLADSASVEVRRNGGDGIYASVGASLAKASIIGNSGNGIVSADELVIAGNNNEIAYNSRSGILIDSPNPSSWATEIEDVYVHHNGEWGLLASGPVVIVQRIRANDNGEGGIGSESAGDNDFAIDAEEVDILEVKRNGGVGVYAVGNVRLKNTDIVSNTEEGILVDGFLDIFGKRNTVAGNGSSGITLLGSKLLATGLYSVLNGENGIRADGAVVEIYNGSISMNEGFGITAGWTDLEGVEVLLNNWGGIVYRSGEMPFSIGRSLADGRVRSSTGPAAGRASSLRYSGSPAPAAGSGSSSIAGSTIANNTGDGIRFESGNSLAVRRSNILGNSGRAINNAVSGASVIAQQNWWGADTDPSAVVSGTVDIANWLSERVSLVVAVSGDPIYATAGLTSTVPVFAQNWGSAGDVVSIAVTDTLGWLVAPTAFTVTLEGSLGGSVAISVAIPATTTASTVDEVRVTAVSGISPTVSDAISFTVVPTPTVSLAARQSAAGIKQVAPARSQTAPSDGRSRTAQKWAVRTAARSGGKSLSEGNSRGRVAPRATATFSSSPRQSANVPTSTNLRSNTLRVLVSKSGWCPQYSYWKGTLVNGKEVTFRFRNREGKLATNGFVINGGAGFANTTLYLYACGCDVPDPDPDKSWQKMAVTADGRRQEQLGGLSPQYFVFNIRSSHGRVKIEYKSQCVEKEDEGEVLIDPDGYVFDVTKGLKVAGITSGGVPIYANTLQGVTVTAYVSMTQWGVWAPWPAQLYDNQINPQVTGPDGYFAFFTPPGFYYLQIDGIPGFQSWRSPVVQVISEVVHVNVPLTPLPASSVYTVTLTPQGLSPGVITVPQGSSVAWVSALSSTATITEVTAFMVDPTLRPRSALDPLVNTLGWDGGMLEPGEVYRRQFAEPGTYTYSDGMGHNGQVIVTGAPSPPRPTPLSALSITGPTQGQVSTTLSFVVTASPLTATQPITYIWTASGQSPVTRTAGLSDTMAFTWVTTGTQQISVAAINEGGGVLGTYLVAINEPERYRVYIPAVLRAYSSAVSGAQAGKR